MRRLGRITAPNGAQKVRMGQYLARMQHKLLAHGRRQFGELRFRCGPAERSPASVDFLVDSLPNLTILEPI